MFDDANGDGVERVRVLAQRGSHVGFFERALEGAVAGDGGDVFIRHKSRKQWIRPLYEHYI